MCQILNKTKLFSTHSFLTVGYLLADTLWYDQSDVSVLVRVRDQVGGVQCASTMVQIRATPSPSLAAVFNVIPQVPCLYAWRLS